ncbi:MAG: hypothetical protein E7313_06185 [Clostridiales bacterium]|nr:hypothetical protein [Clostridiales bacterium]
MDEKLLKQDINRLNLNDNAIDILKQNEIISIGQLCKKTKSNLKNIKLTQNEINKIEIELQLLGLNLKNNL